MPVLSKWIVLLIDVVILSLAACTAPTPAPTRGPASEGFAIYLPAQKIAANEMLEANLSDLELEDKPILSVDDIITYSKSTHEIELTPAGYERLSQLSVPTAGMPFVVCVDRGRCVLEGGQLRKEGDRIICPESLEEEGICAWMYRGDGITRRRCYHLGYHGDAEYRVVRGVHVIAARSMGQRGRCRL